MSETTVILKHEAARTETRGQGTGVYFLLLLLFVQMQKYFLGLKSTLPSMSPVDQSWPARPYLFLDGVHRELRRIFHLWRVSLELKHLS